MKKLPEKVSILRKWTWIVWPEQVGVPRVKSYCVRVRRKSCFTGAKTQLQSRECRSNTGISISEEIHFIIFVLYFGRVASSGWKYSSRLFSKSSISSLVQTASWIHVCSYLLTQHQTAVCLLPWKVSNPLFWLIY